MGCHSIRLFRPLNRYHKHGVGSRGNLVHFRARCWSALGPSLHHFKNLLWTRHRSLGQTVHENAFFAVFSDLQQSAFFCQKICDLLVVDLQIRHSDTLDGLRVKLGAYVKVVFIDLVENLEDRPWNDTS